MCKYFNEPKANEITSVRESEISSSYCTTSVINCLLYIRYFKTVAPQSLVFRGTSTMHLRILLSRTMHGALERSIWENIERSHNTEILKGKFPTYNIYIYNVYTRAHNITEFATYIESSVSEIFVMCCVFIVSLLSPQRIFLARYWHRQCHKGEM